MSARSGGWLRFALSAALSLVLVSWLLRDLGVGALASTLRAVWVPGVIGGVAVFALMLGLRVIRYQLLLAAPAPWPGLTLITMVRGMLADLLPARLGTLSYVWLVTTRTSVPLDDALSSFFLAFVLDMVAIAPLLLLALAVAGFGLEAASVLALAAIALLLLSTTVLWLLAPGLRVAARVATPIGERLQALLVATAGRVEEARSRGVLLPALLVSLGIRLAKFGAHYLILQSALVALDLEWGALGFFEAFLGLAGAEMSAMLPVSGLGAFGTWEAAFAFGFGHLGLSREQAVLAGFTTHVVTQAHDYILGVAALLILMRPRYASRRS